jgi:hypothetical protein
MSDPLSAYVHRSTLVDDTGVQSEGVNKVANYIWDSALLAWVKSTGGGGGPSTSVSVTNFPSVQVVSSAAVAKIYDPVDSTTAYLGDAAVGSSAASSVWRIQRLSFSVGGGVTVQWAGGSATYVNIWNARASLVYS